MSGDPRPDLVDDSSHWRCVLDRAASLDLSGAHLSGAYLSGANPDGCYGRFLYLRCYGIRLVPGDGTLVLRPRDDPENQAEWPQLRDKVLEPRRDEMARILRECAGS